MNQNPCGYNTAYQSCLPHPPQSSGGGGSRYYGSNPSRHGEGIGHGGVCGVNSSCA